MDELTRIENELIMELEKEFRHMMWRMASDHPIPGMDTQDVVQELRIKMWKVVHGGKYDPTRHKPSTFFYKVFQNYLRNMYRDANRQKRAYDMLNAYPLSLDYSETDESGSMPFYETEITVSVTYRHVHCDLCASIIDPHSNWAVLNGNRPTDPETLCEDCAKERGVYHSTDTNLIIEHGHYQEK